MSIVRCDHCDKNIDTDYDAEHFKDGTEQCSKQVYVELLRQVKKEITTSKKLKKQSDRIFVITCIAIAINIMAIIYLLSE